MICVAPCAVERAICGGVTDVTFAIGVSHASVGSAAWASDGAIICAVGVVAICDPRLVSKGYGKKLLASLPPMRRSRSLLDVGEMFRTILAARAVPERA